MSYRLRPDDVQLQLDFLRELKARLGQRLLVVAVSPQVDDQFEYARGLDYTGIGRVADRVLVMNYEFHWIGGPPGPTAPLPQVRRVLQYAAERIPRGKLLNGMPTYAYDWPVPWARGVRARGITSQEALALALQQQAPIRYDETRQAPWFRYQEDGQKREVWFDDARSLMARLRLVREMGLRGLGIWHLAMEVPALRPLVQRLFAVAR